MDKAIGSRAKALAVRVCGHCKEEKPINQFPGRGAKKHAWCKLCMNEDNRKRYHANPEYHKERHKTYYWKNYEASRKYQTDRSSSLRHEAIMAYGGYVCTCCGETESLFLTIDHINNDGHEHRKLTGGSAGLSLWLKKNDYPAGFQILCMNCNWGKMRNKGICPHKAKEGSTTIP